MATWPCACRWSRRSSPGPPDLTVSRCDSGCTLAHLAATVRHQRLPGLKSNFVGLTTLYNMDEDFGFEDVLDGDRPALPSLPVLLYPDGVLLQFLR